MKVFYGYRGLNNRLRDPVLAIGIFDGIHIGHRRVLARVLNLRGARRDRAVLTFDPHPAAVLRPDRSPPRIMSLEHRIRILESVGLDAVIVVRFTAHIASMSPEDFIQKVIVPMKARDIFVGENFCFGKSKSGNTDEFKRLGRSYGINVGVVRPVKNGSRIVSSTRVRKLITSGRLKEAEKLLKRPVSVLGTVVGGDKRGKSLGVPTANIDPHHEVVPPGGVYAVKVDDGRSLRDGVLNIGYRPTFYDKKVRTVREPLIEVHIMDFDRELYGRSLEIFFIKKLRSEKRFRTQKNLVRAIGSDMRKARDVLEKGKVLERICRYKSL